MISLMKTYLVKYSITFSADEYDDVVVKNEMLVKEGIEFFDEDKEDNAVVKDKGTAADYVRSLYYNDEYNIVDVPKEVSQRKEGIGDTQLNIL